MNKTKRLGRAAKVGPSPAVVRKDAEKRGVKVKHKAWPKFGVQCLACHQRIKPLSKRYPVKTDAGIAFRHVGCTVAQPA
jgi:hypothetical protein